VTPVPTDHASGSIVIDAPPADILAVLRDVAAQPQWAAQVTSAELLEEYEDGTPATAAFELATPMGNDQFTLEFAHADDGMSWKLVSSRMQTAQDGWYRLQPTDDGRTDVTLDLTVEHGISVPGFLRKQLFQGWVDGSLRGLKKYVESGGA
jgi:Polyketide cyclase / dehydrase and lipid transport